MSDIVGSLTPKFAAERLQGILKSFPQFSGAAAVAQAKVDRESIVESMREFLEVLKKETPVINVSRARSWAVPGEVAPS